MDPSTILNKIEEHYSSLSKECFEALVNKLSLKSIPKGEVLVREGQFAKKAYFILQGCARAYYLKDGKDISDWFAFENEFISPIVSFFGNEPSPHYIETLQDAVVAEITRESIEQLSDEFHEIERLIRIEVTNTMLSQQNRISSILFHTAEERYKKLLSINPDITKRVPLMHIASYLGITIETLSRVRSSIRI